MGHGLSVIIPAYNESASLPRLLDALAAERCEVIVSDGGSDDGSRDIACTHGVQAIQSMRGRGVQMNAGAAAARGDQLLFLHADTLPPEGFPKLIDRALASPGTVAGAFRLRIDAAGRAYRMIERAVNRRSRRRQLPYGDQGLFMTAGTFEGVGGFPDWPAMEDYELVHRLRRLGAITLTDEAATTSPRGWARRGWLQTTLLNQACVAAYRLGVAPGTIARWRA